MYGREIIVFYICNNGEINRRKGCITKINNKNVRSKEKTARQ